MTDVLTFQEEIQYINEQIEAQAFHEAWGDRTGSQFVYGTMSYGDNPEEDRQFGMVWQFLVRNDPRVATAVLAQLPFVVIAIENPELGR